MFKEWQLMAGEGCLLRELPLSPTFSPDPDSTLSQRLNSWSRAEWSNFNQTLHFVDIIFNLFLSQSQCPL